MAPCPGLLSTSIIPPTSLTMRCTVARPSPVPFPGFLVVKKGSNSRARVSASIPQPLSFTVSETARRAIPGSALLDALPGNSAARVINQIFLPLRHRIARVQHQVHQDLPQLHRIGEHKQAAGVEC